MGMFGGKLNLRPDTQLGTRFAAFGLLLMTCIVELTVPDGWPIHITWAAMALGIMAWGPGRLSLDYALARIAGLPFSSRVSAVAR